VARTGRLYAYEHYGIEPDILASAKGIGGGFPMGACLATREAAAGMVAGSHGTTFGGNPLAMAVGNAVLDVVLADGFLDHVQQTALLFRQRLAELKDRHPGIVAEVRGHGLMMGLKLHVPNTAFVKAAEAAGLLVIAAGDNVVRLLPPLVIGGEEVGEAFARLDRAASALEAEMREQAA
ncbi:MAG: aminotransferase class III-fold pyridoxal phosphate-dependent enzyme, partial [Methylobacteriaceae bacterium]|nr:aminotransferase class III-fold pyridoxal phosphate-dependent enzyme [Methylobacteriaceae bacterium]